MQRIIGRLLISLAVLTTAITPMRSESRSRRKETRYQVSGRSMLVTHEEGYPVNKES